MFRVKCNKGGKITPLFQNIFIIVLVLYICYFLQLSECNEDVTKSSLSYSENTNINEGETNLELFETTSTDHIINGCINKCPEENRTNSEHLTVGCDRDCYVRQCRMGCILWELALNSSCQAVCNKTNEDILEPKELYCVMGCNDALNRYFKWLRAEVGTPPAPALVADTLTATSLSLEWQIPPKLIELTKGKKYTSKSYLVQWRYEEVAGDWKFCRNQSMGDNSTVRVDNLQPYTKYRFRVALPLSPNYNEVLVSEQSVIISTLAMGIPLSEPAIVRAVAVDHTRISVSWEPGPFPNGPILSYVLQIKDLSTGGYSAIKDISASENINFYMFDKLGPSKNYAVQVSMRNAEGEGPAAEIVVATPSPPPIKDDEPEPRLILGAEYTVLSQGSDILSEPPAVFYTSNYRILGIAVHIQKQLIFVSDEAGFINKAPLERTGKNEAIISPHSGLNFSPNLLSMDWLNDHLYILGKVMHPNSQTVWQISRCGLNGRSLTIAIAGLHKKPNHIQVDPFNGYLFWVITGSSLDTGLFRLDLADISNGVKHEVKPLHLIQGENLGAFVVDYTRFRILVPPQDENTIISVNLDGKDKEDIRKNTQSPKLNIVKSLAMANGIFYWTNGSDLFMEDHHKEEDNYYHNVYPGLSNSTFISVSVNLPSTQPVPVPVNPPRYVQALLSARKAKISWKIPHLLGNQGKGAWQEWNYELEIIDGTSISNVTRNIKGTYFTVDKLKPNTNYTFRAAAYTNAGKGPWSTEFCAKTLKSSHDRYLIWSSSDGLLQSDVIGEHIHTLIPKSELGEHDISDMTWFEDVLFFVTNSTLKFYNRTTGLLAKFGDLDSVESIGIDWIGRRIYWSNPTQQLITRSSLNGEDKEPLPILAVARELEIDSLHGHLYYSAGHGVEVCRLNGKSRMTYFKVPLYSGKQVMGLTLDMDNERIFWIVRSYEGSSLFSAPMAKNWNKDVNPIETTLEERTLNGPLTHFSDRLLWLQDDHTVIVGDMTGKNLAHIRSSKLNGLKSISVIDPTHHVYPNLTTELNVIPERINSDTIRISGTWKAFNITWEPVRTVTYGEIFYEVRIHSEIDTDVIKEITTPHFHYVTHTLPPYTPLNITVRAFTYWGSCKPTYAQLYSPAAAPSVPTKPRIFVTHQYDPFKGGLNISTTFRWGSPAKPNGPIVGYKIYCWYEEEGIQKQLCDDFQENSEELLISNLIQNMSYYFQVQAFTYIEGGPRTHPIQVNSNYENPVPKILLTTSEHILEIDLDLNKTKIIAHTGNPIAHLCYLEYEHRILWINENRELISFNGTKTKISTATDEVIALTVDWIERIVYWSQIDQDHGSSIYRLDLNRVDGKFISGEMILSRTGIVRDLRISPFSQTIFWLEFENYTSEFGSLIEYNLNLKVEIGINENVECLNNTFMRLIYDNPSVGENKLILVTNNERIFSYGLQSHMCTLYKVRYDSKSREIVKDSGHIYVLKNQNILSYNYKQNLQYIVNATEVKRIFAYFHQNYPSKWCLLPKPTIMEQEHIPELVQKTEYSLLLQLPQPQNHFNCSHKLPGIKYLISYSELGDTNNFFECRQPNCKSLVSFDTLTSIGELRPYTKYQFQVGVTNFYAERIGMNTKFGPVVVLSTAPGAPSSPRNITAESISPTEAIIQWARPVELNSDYVWYEVHWQTENPVSKVLNRQQRLVTAQENIFGNSSEKLAITLSKLLPNQNYTIWIQAYSTNISYSTSQVVQIKTFSEPDNITVVEATAYSLRLRWKSNPIISQYFLEYVQVGSDEIQIAADSENDDRPENEREFFLILNLTPKTSYKFCLRILYFKRYIPYIWPTDNRFIFETLGDRPSAPGKPVIHHVSGDVYKVTWEPAKENGAFIEEYSLEALLSRITNRVIRSAIQDTNSTSSAYEVPASRNYTILQSQIPWVEELEPIEEKWIVYYNGTDAYWIVKDLHPINLFSFRVRARNSYGWGPYSSMSEPISEPYVSPERRDSLLIAIFVPVMVVGCCIGFAICTIFVLQRRLTNKKLMHGTGTRLPGVELASLPELPRGTNFIHANNILYISGPLTDADIASLPQIKRDQITISSFLGSGAFGEVYEGIVRNAYDVPETRVAIKTLRKGATKQEKDEFLQEAKLMSNFKHKHILMLIGVCIDSDSLYIIMELMQGGDLLSYLRQSRPTAGTPSSLTLLDLISMCVDVASGCRYLEEMHFVHRDLACRNCLVSSIDPEYRVVKIGDFGLARDIYKNDYYRKEGEGLLPVRWMSPESLMDGVFTSQSDIWAFGVLCWEIMTLGQQPYPARNNLEVLNYVKDGGRLGKPADCPEELYQLMLKCWSYMPDDRPSFKYCLSTLQNLKDRTNNSVRITAPDTNKFINGGIFNPSYLGSDVNHNHTEDTIKYSSDGNPQRQIEPPVIITPTSSTTSTIIPKYLELLYDSNDKQQISNVGPDGYEIPVNTVKGAEFVTYVVGAGCPSERPHHHYHDKNNKKNKQRTFSSSSTISRSSSLNLIDNIRKCNQLKPLSTLTVALPPLSSSSQEYCNYNNKCISNQRNSIITNNRKLNQSLRNLKTDYHPDEENKSVI